MNTALNKSTVLRFIILIGIVNLFADMTYEGGRSVVGAFLGVLGASAAAVGIVTGFGEFAGYALRSVSGYIADKTGKYWIVVVVGYAINMLAVPALALAGSWPVAAALVIAERTGRAIRRPSVEAMISYSSKQVGRGRAFGLNESLDQVGATVGPLIVALVLYLKGGFRMGFAVLIIPALLCVGAVIAARFLYPHPERMEAAQRTLQTKGFPQSYWFYLGAGALIAAGFVDFSLIAFHFSKAATVPNNWIPIFYAVAMGFGALATLVFGRLLDEIGFPIVIVAFLVSALFAPLVFLGHFYLALLGMMLWGIGMGAQDSVLKAVLSGVVSPERRSTAFGVFDTGFGVAWFAGSAAMGLLYDKSILALVLLSVVLQLAALPVFLLARNRQAAAEAS